MNKCDLAELERQILQIETELADAKLRAEKAEAAETVALAKWNGTLERAMKAEAETKAVDETAKAMIQIAEERAEKAEAELAAERARLDWLDLTATAILLAPRDRRLNVNSTDVRAAIDAAMKEETTP